MNINKRGLSDIVTNVLIILLVLVAIGIIWFFVSPFIRSGAGSIEGTQECLTLQLSPVSCIESTTDGTYNVVFRREGAGSLQEARLIFTDANGNSVVRNVNTTANLPGEFETRNVQFTGLIPNPVRVDVAAVIDVEDPAGRVCDPGNRPVNCA